ELVEARFVHAEYGNELRTLRLVVLSACDTARAQDDPRAEVLGLPEAFVTAGAPAVVASLWSVYSWTTTDLMVEFYREVAKGSDLASAMREARRALIGKKEGIYAHPFYWAPFLLFGDWR
ncbi:MAG: CHAT domain-containing protein, partial [Planctomycetota bacterium]